VFGLQLTPEEKEYHRTPKGARELLRKYKQSRLYQIHLAMMVVPEEAKVGPGFAVESTNRKSLQGIYDVLVKSERPVEHFPARTEVSLVFFARPGHPNIQLDEVVRKGNRIEIRYMLSHRVVQTSVVNPYLAMIPLGELPEGKYRVEMIRLMEKEKQLDRRQYVPAETGIEKRVVSESFSFEVVEQP
jgi:hypothetical protein